MTKRHSRFDRDGNGLLTERAWVGDEEVIIHYDDMPEKDTTTVDGIPCTTAVRTVIDVAPEIEAAELDRVLQDCLARHLFTLEELTERATEDDMVERPGAILVRQAVRRRRLAE